MPPDPADARHLGTERGRTPLALVRIAADLPGGPVATTFREAERLLSQLRSRNITTVRTDVIFGMAQRAD